MEAGESKRPRNGRRRRSAVSAKIAAAMFCMPLAACSDTGMIEQTYPSPDGNVVLIHQWEGGGGAAGWTSYTAFLQGEGAKDRIDLGTVDYPDRQSVFWRDNNSVNVCSSNEQQKVMKVKLAGYDHRERAYSVTFLCPALTPQEAAELARVTAK